MSGIDKSKKFAENHPSGQSSATNHKAQSQLTDGSKAVQQQAYDKVTEVITAPFDFLKWVCDNWQLAIIGGLAIYILIKD